MSFKHKYKLKKKFPVRDGKKKIGNSIILFFKYYIFAICLKIKSNLRVRKIQKCNWAFLLLLLQFSCALPAIQVEFFAFNFCAA